MGQRRFHRKWWWTTSGFTRTRGWQSPVTLWLLWNPTCYVRVWERRMSSRMDRRAFRKMSRRELLKLAPVAALGAFAIPRLRTPLLKAGLATSDWISEKLFRTGHLATTFADSELTPFERFPINGYDVDDPSVIFENWTLTVSG